MSSSQFKLLLLLQIVTLFLVGMLFFKPSAVSNVGKPLSGIPVKGIAGKNVGKVAFGDNYVFGSPEAKNELVVFSRYNCGFCRDFYNETFDSLKVKYVLTGKLKIVFMDNVNPTDQQGMLMAQVAEIGKQLDLYEAIQTQLYKGNQPEDSLEVIERALSVGMNEQQLKDLLGKTETTESVLKDNLEVDRLQLTGTPSFVINGNIIVGFKGYQEFITQMEQFMVQ